MSKITSDFPLLAQIDLPADLRQLQPSQLPLLANEIRQFMIQALNQCGGHFAANLGTVELTIALHYLYDTPHDRLVWDVGHQAYPHKILTGRKDRLHQIKQAGGLSPFPKRSESEYDTFGTGHSSTSLSAALGMCLGSNTPRKIVAVIGDGGLTGGMALEALNHGGGLDPNMLIILNDNEMSISANVGALTQYFGRLLAGKWYCNLRENSKKILTKMPSPLSKWIKRTETHLKGMVQPGTLFEELGFNYFGPIDGHNLPQLLTTIGNLQSLSGARILHIKTTKGKGYPPAEADPIKYHAVSAHFHPPTERPTAPQSNAPTYSNVFGQWACDMAAIDPDLIAITPAMCEGSDLVQFSQQYPARYYDVSIAEQHALTFAAGLACEGKKPVVAIYSTFLQRAYDQLIHDIALQDLDVTLAIDRAGLVGSDGPSHAGSFDLTYLACIPNLIIMAPTDENECRQMLYTGYQHPGPAAIRYPRGTGPGATIQSNMQALTIGKASYCRRGQDIAILAFGSMLTPALAAGEALNATVVNMRFIKPLDLELIQQVASQHSLVVTIEENSIIGGAGSSVSYAIQQSSKAPATLILGLPDRFIAHGNQQVMLSELQLDSAGIIAQIKQKLTTLAAAKSAAVT